MEEVCSRDGTTIAFERLGDGRTVIVVGDGMPRGQLNILEGQEHVVPPEILVPVLVEFFEG